MSLFINRCVVSVVDGFADNEGPIERAKIVGVGESPHVTAKLYSWDGARFREYDRLTDATLTEGQGSLQLMGISARLRDEIGVSDEDAIATWFVDPTKGCTTCG